MKAPNGRGSPHAASHDTSRIAQSQTAMPLIAPLGSRPLVSNGLVASSYTGSRWQNLLTRTSRPPQVASLLRVSHSGYVFHPMTFSRYILIARTSRLPPLQRRGQHGQAFAISGLGKTLTPCVQFHKQFSYLRSSTQREHKYGAEREASSFLRRESIYETSSYVLFSAFILYYATGLQGSILTTDNTGQQALRTTRYRRRQAMRVCACERLRALLTFCPRLLLRKSLQYGCCLSYIHAC